MDDSGQRYLSLLKKCLTFSLWEETLYYKWDLVTEDPPAELLAIDKQLRNLGLCLAQECPHEPEVVREGNRQPYLAHTMIGMKRLNNLQFCIEQTIQDDVPGDILEAGVWRGGACILARGVLKARGITNKSVWVADSFQGLPVPDPARYPADTDESQHLNARLQVSLETVKRNFENYELLDEQVRFLPCWFKDTLSTAPIERLSVLRMDGDMYESTMDALSALYHKVAIGGYVIVDDYDGPPCRQAVTDFRDSHQIQDEIIPIDNNGVFWRRQM